MGHDKNGMHDRIPPGGPALVQAQERFLFALGLFTGDLKRAPDAPTQWIIVSTWGGARVAHRSANLMHHLRGYVQGALARGARVHAASSERQLRLGRMRTGGTAMTMNEEMQLLHTGGLSQLLQSLLLR